VDAKTPPNPFKLTASPPKKRSDYLADRSKKSAASKVAAARMLREKNTKSSKSPPAQRAKSIGNTSSYPKNIIYYEDTAPLSNHFDTYYTKAQIAEFGFWMKAYENIGIKGQKIQAKETELLKSKNKFTNESILFFHCLNLLSKTGKLNDFHLYGHSKLGKPNKSINQIRIEFQEHQKNPVNIFTPKSPAQTANPFNKPPELWKNMRAYFLDTDGICFDKCFTPETRYDPQKISCTVNAVENFFHSATLWLKGTEKFLGVVHPNAESVKFTGFNTAATTIVMNTHVNFSAFGYGYSLPPEYLPPNTKKLALKIPQRLLKSMFSNCDDLIESHEETPYCEKPTIAAYIAKNKQNRHLKNENNSKIKVNDAPVDNPNWRELEDICTKLKPNMIKDVFTKTNFVTLYRVKKIDSTHVTIEKETFDEPAKKSLEKKLDEMLSRLEEE
jgi:hypothetical protein